MSAAVPTKPDAAGTALMVPLITHAPKTEGPNTDDDALFSLYREVSEDLEKEKEKLLFTPFDSVR